MVAKTSTSFRHFALNVKHTGYQEEDQPSDPHCGEKTQEGDCMHQVRIQERANFKPSHEPRKKGSRKPSTAQDKLNHCPVQRFQILFGKTVCGLGIIEQTETIGVKENDSDSDTVGTARDFFESVLQFIQLL